MNLQIFSYMNNQIHTIQDSGEPMFLLKDVVKVLGLSNSRMVKERLGDDVSSTYPIQDSLGRTQQATFINEDGLYDVILDSRKPEAKKFRKWITSEVIPSIRKTGGYVANDDLFINTYLPQADDQTKTLFRTTLQTMKAQNDQIELMKPKARFAESVEASEDCILIRELARIMKQDGIDTGEKRLFEWLRANGYLIKQEGRSYNLPTQRSADLDLFRVKKSTRMSSDGTTKVTRTPTVTGKGQIYFLNKFDSAKKA